MTVTVIVQPSEKDTFSPEDTRTMQIDVGVGACVWKHRSRAFGLFRQYRFTPIFCH